MLGLAGLNNREKKTWEGRKQVESGRITDTIIVATGDDNEVEEEMEYA